MFDYSTLPHPDYDNHRGMAGHKPATPEEARQGYVKRSWGNRVVRLRCCFCPFDSPMDEAGMQLHVYQMHWLKFNAQESPQTQAVRPPEARLFSANGELVTEMPVTSADDSPLHVVRSAPTLNAPAPPPIAGRTSAQVENFQATGVESYLEALTADMVREGLLTNGKNED